MILVFIQCPIMFGTNLGKSNRIEQQITNQNILRVKLLMNVFVQHLYIRHAVEYQNNEGQFIKKRFGIEGVNDQTNASSF